MEAEIEGHSGVATEGQGHKGVVAPNPPHTRFSDSCKSGKKFEGGGVGAWGVMFSGVRQPSQYCVCTPKT